MGKIPSQAEWEVNLMLTVDYHADNGAAFCR
jgi:hypothetical protein